MHSVRILYEGSFYVIGVLYEDQACSVQQFIEGLEGIDSTQLAFLIDFIKDHGPPKNEEKFRHEGDRIYALKTKNVRIYGFFDGPQTFVLALGFMKNAGGRRVERRFHKMAIKLRQSLLDEREGLV